MSWPPLHTFFVIIVTSVAANHQGANCDCASQGPWQPLFKPSQILHSEFPEHKHSSSTGGAKPTKVRHYKLVPHIVVPLVNPLAYTIHHQNDNHIHNDDDEKHNYKTKDNYDKQQIKAVHYHYTSPDPNDPNSSKFNDFPSTPTPSDETYTNNNYPEEESAHHNYPDEGSHEHDSHHSQEDESTNYNVNPTSEGATGHSYESNQEQNYNSHEEQPTYNPYYGSGEHNDAVYDASKLSLGFAVKPDDYRPVYPGNDKHYSNNYQNNIDNKITVREKTRGKSIYIPIYRITQPSNMLKGPENSILPYKSQEASTHKPMPIVLPTLPTAIHMDHHKLHLKHLGMIKNYFHEPIPITPLPLVHPPFSMYNPWKFLMKDETKRMAMMRPPAPGLPDTWMTSQSSSNNQVNIIPSKVKMTGVIYPLKHFQI